MKILTTTLLYLPFIGILTACGGKGSESNVSTPSNISTSPETSVVNTYEPDIAKINESATSSSELYVEPDFDFDTSAEVTFTFSVTNPHSDNTIVKVYTISDNIEDSSELREDEKSLLFIQRVDNSGFAQISQDLPPNIIKVLAVANIIGSENNIIKPIDASIIDFEF